MQYQHRAITVVRAVSTSTIQEALKISTPVRPTSSKSTKMRPAFISSSTKPTCAHARALTVRISDGTRQVNVVSATAAAAAVSVADNAKNSKCTVTGSIDFALSPSGYACGTTRFLPEVQSAEAPTPRATITTSKQGSMWKVWHISDGDDVEDEQREERTQNSVTAWSPLEVPSPPSK